MYASETVSGRILKIDISSTSTFEVTEVVATEAGLEHPKGLAIKGDELYIAQSGNGNISKITIPDDIASITSSNDITDLVINGLISQPDDLVFDGNDLYISDATSNQIFKLDTGGSITFPLPSEQDIFLYPHPHVPPVVDTGADSSPRGLAIIGGFLFIAQRGGDVISRVCLTTPCNGTLAVAGAVSCVDTAGNSRYAPNEKFALSGDDFEVNSFKVYPNPTSEFIFISGLTKTEAYKIYNVLGLEMMKGTISNEQKLNIQNLVKGLYFLKFESGGILKFIKE